MRDVAIILNPAARGARSEADRDALVAAIRAVVPQSTLHLTACAGDAVRQARVAVEEGATELIAVGGDGTLHEVINGVGQAGALDGRITITPVNAGTGGDFRRLLTHRGRAGDLAAARAAAPVRMDVGHVAYRPRPDGVSEVPSEGEPGVMEERWFFNIASTGMSGLVDRFVNASSKRFGGTLTFGFATMRAFLRYRPPRVEVRVDGESLGVRSLRVAVAANGQYFGGGMQIAAEARVDDGLLDFLVIEDGPALSQMMNMPKLYRGEVAGARGVTRVQGRVMEVRPLEDEGPCWMDLDGEAPGVAPATFRVVHGAVMMRDLRESARQDGAR